MAAANPAAESLQQALLLLPPQHLRTAPTGLSMDSSWDEIAAAFGSQNLSNCHPAPALMEAVQNS